MSLTVAYLQLAKHKSAGKQGYLGYLLCLGVKGSLVRIQSTRPDFSKVSLCAGLFLVKEFSAKNGF